MPAGSRWLTKAILVPSGDHAGHEAPSPGSFVSCVMPEPSGLTVKICDAFPTYLANTILPLPPGGVAPAGRPAMAASTVEATTSTVSTAPARRAIGRPPKSPDLESSIQFQPVAEVC